MVTGENFDIFASFRKDKCTLCGECFNRCPVMQLPIDEAVREIKRLMAGEETKRVLQHCTSCFICNFVCPEHCNPTQLILQRWHERYSAQGLPLRAEWFIPHYKPNFRTYVLERLPADEQKMLKAWSDLTSCKEIVYPGCNYITSPYLTRTSLLEGLEFRGSLDVCCGEMYYRMGLFEQIEQVANRLDRYFGKLQLKKMLIPCTAGYNMFNNILPRFGFKPDFEIQHLLVWLWQRIEEGGVQIKNQVELRATIQDSCYGKMFGEEILDIARRILAKVGVEVAEMEYCRHNSLCCGIAGGFSPGSGYSPFRIASSTIRSLRCAQATRANAIVVYCAGCLQMLSTGKILYPTRMPIYHLLEILQMAIGETPLRRQNHRGKLFLLGMLQHQSPKLISRKRFQVQTIEQE
ncbi:MAG TPA: (Fe-S)-binding protein [Dehalococcoidia bacterium]|nr:(Fe-S)-binding protein [Dehalococcoidia bacterium]